MAKQFWLMKSEPDVYSYDDLVAEGEGTWDGVRNYSAANNLRTMKVGDQAFFYHSNIGLEIVAIITISQEHFIDPTDEKARFVAVKVKPSRKLAQSVNRLHPLRLRHRARPRVFPFRSASRGKCDAWGT